MVNTTRQYDGEWDASKGAVAEDILHLETVLNHVVGQTLDASGTLLPASAGSATVLRHTRTVLTNTMVKNWPTQGGVPGLYVIVPSPSQQTILIPDVVTVRANTVLGAYTGLIAGATLTLGFLGSPHIITSLGNVVVNDGVGFNGTGLTILLGAAHRARAVLRERTAADATRGSVVTVTASDLRGQPLCAILTNGGANLGGGHPENTVTFESYYVLETGD